MGSYIEPPQKPWIETPLIESLPLSRAAGCRIFLKLENHQPSRSFKSRGIGNLVLEAVTQHINTASTKLLHFYSSSGGNAGLACVTAAVSLGYPATVVVPLSTAPAMIAKIYAAGAAEVIQKGATWSDADAFLRTEVMGARGADEECVYCPPFDHPAVWAGAATMVDEIAVQLPDGGPPDAVICSVGGGGLLCGIAEGMSRAGWGSIPVLAVETQGAASLHASVVAGKLTTLPGITSIAKSLGAVRVAQKAFDVTMDPKRQVRSCVLSDAAACAACVRLADDHPGLLVEPACGVSVAGCYIRGWLGRMVKWLGRESRVVVVVCGGSGVSEGLLDEWRAKYEGGLDGDGSC